MANRIVVKKSIDDQGNEKHAYEWIIDFLKTGKKQFGEIKKFLAENDIQYASDKGLDLALKSLIRQEKIGKRTRLRQYPVYFLKKKAHNSTIQIAQEFRIGVFHNFRRFPGIDHLYQELTDEDVLNNMIYFFGLYQLYIQMKSWNFTSKTKPHSENSESRGLWLRNTSPIGIESLLLEEGIRDLTGLRFHNTTEEFFECTSKIYENKKKSDKLNELTEKLKKMFPEEIQFFDQILEEAPERSKQTSKSIREMHAHEAWIKRLERKNKKKSKKILKPTECPRCNYDGTTKVKYGSMKGEIFEKGFVLEPGIEHQGRHCPACGLWENILNS